MEREVVSISRRKSVTEELTRLSLAIPEAFLKMLFYVPAFIVCSLLDDLRDRKVGRDVV